MELMNEDLTRIVIFERDTEPLVFKPPYSANEADKEIRKTMLRNTEIRKLRKNFFLSSFRILLNQLLLGKIGARPKCLNFEEFLLVNWRQNPTYSTCC